MHCVDVLLTLLRPSLSLSLNFSFPARWSIRIRELFIVFGAQGKKKKRKELNNTHTMCGGTIEYRDYVCRRGRCIETEVSASSCSLVSSNFVRLKFLSFVTAKLCQKIDRDFAVRHCQ